MHQQIQVKVLSMKAIEIVSCMAGLKLSQETESLPIDVSSLLSRSTPRYTYPFTTFTSSSKMMRYY